MAYLSYVANSGQLDWAATSSVLPDWGVLRLETNNFNGLFKNLLGDSSGGVREADIKETARAPTLLISENSQKDAEASGVGFLTWLCPTDYQGKPSFNHRLAGAAEQAYGFTWYYTGDPQ